MDIVTNLDGSTSFDLSSLLRSVHALPNELLYIIFSHLPPQHLKVFRLLNRRMCQITTEALFRMLYITMQHEEGVQRLIDIPVDNYISALVREVHIVWQFDPELRMPPSNELLKSAALRVAALPNLDQAVFEESWPQGSREQFIERLQPCVRHVDVNEWGYEFMHNDKGDLDINVRWSGYGCVALRPSRWGCSVLTPTLISHGLMQDVWEPLNVTRLVLQDVAIDVKYLEMLIMSQAHPKPPLKRLHLINCVLGFRAEENPELYAEFSQRFVCPFMVLFDTIKFLNENKLETLPDIMLRNVTKLGWNGGVTVKNEELIEWLRDYKDLGACAKWVEQKLAHIELPPDQYLVEPSPRNAKDPDVIAVLKFHQKNSDHAGPRRRWILRALDNEVQRRSHYRTVVEGILPHVKTPWILIKKVGTGSVNRSSIAGQ